jgi:hypothetical protein
MKKLMMVLVVLGLLAVSSPGAFATDNWWFAQDDFVLDFSATPNNPGAPGATIALTGRIVNWDAPGIVGWFQISGIGSGAQSVGSQWVTDYISNLDIFGPLDNTMVGAPVWSGAGVVQTVVNQDGSEFPASGAIRPGWETNPSSFKSVGTAEFVASYASCDWATCEILGVPWFGTYNWNYIPNTPPYLKQTGNMQGALTCIPEPISVVLGALGLAAVGGFRRLRK